MGISMSGLRRLNAGELLRCALAVEQFTAAEAMEVTGLTRATVLGLCDQLTEAGWLDEIEDSRVAGLSRRGRPARRHRFRAEAGVLVGVDAGRRGYRASVTDLRGVEQARAEREVDPPGLDRDRRARLVAELVDEALAQVDAPGPPLLTVVGIPAPVDAHGVSPVEVSAFWRTMNAGFPDHLAGRVRVENDANLAALAEHARHPEDNLAALLLSDRIGAGLIVDGRLLHGAHGGAGEMRFLDAVLQDDVGAAGVATLARDWALAALAALDAPPSVLASIPRDRLAAPDVFAAAEAGDALAAAVLDRIGERIARIAAILASLLGTERIVVAGAVAPAMGPVLEHARSVLPGVVEAPFARLAASELGQDVVVRGAIEHALSLLRTDPLDLLDPRP